VGEHHGQSELMVNVEQIRQAELALQAVDDFLPCADEASAKASASATARTWAGPDCWARIGWAPDTLVRGGYWVEVNANATDFTVHGVFDGDGDGTWMHVRATKADAATSVSADGVK
jgi:hypothetical protein